MRGACHCLPVGFVRCEVGYNDLGEEGRGALVPFLRRPEVWRAVVVVGVGRGGGGMVDILS